MKKGLLVLLCCVLLAGCVGSESTEKTIIEETIYEPETIDCFEKANYDKYNSYASENGLGDTPIYIEGTVINQTKIEEKNSEMPTLALVVEQEDGNRWCASVASETEIEEIDNREVRIFGTYLGYSDVFNLPGLAVVYWEDEEKLQLARIEIKENNQYHEVWNFYDNYAKDEIEKFVSEQDENSNTNENDLQQNVQIESEITNGQRNALDSALSYLSFSAFSYTGLINQLEYEGYTTEEATYAANNCGADWNEQAAKSAESYLSFSSFSREGLIEQLEYEGFTHEQAVYGAEQNGY